MRHSFITTLTLSLLFILVLGAGCDKGNTGPPPPLAAEQIPPAFNTAFAKAKPELKALANQVVTALQAQDISKAFQDVQGLAAQSGLSKEQQSVTSRAMLTINGLLQSAAQTKGDVKAAETLKAYRVNK
jgi:hypothetical protein